MKTKCFNMTLSSELANLPAGNFNIIATPAITFKGQWQVCLTQLGLWYTVATISSSLNNNAFAYSTNSGVSYTNASLPTGLYEIADINTAVQLILSNASLPPANIVISYVNATGCSTIWLAQGYCFDLTKSNLNQILGFTQQVLGPAGTGGQLYTSTNQINITNGEDGFVVHLPEIIDNSSSLFGNGGGSDVVFSQPWSVEGQYFNNCPIYFKQWYTVKENLSLSKITVKITDLTGNILDFDQGLNYANNASQLTLNFRQVSDE